VVTGGSVAWAIAALVVGLYVKISRHGDIGGLVKKRGSTQEDLVGLRMTPVTRSLLLNKIKPIGNPLL
jgi:hypothetical protein